MKKSIKILIVLGVILVAVCGFVFICLLTGGMKSIGNGSKTALLPMDPQMYVPKIGHTTAKFIVAKTTATSTTFYKFSGENNPVESLFSVALGEYHRSISGTLTPDKKAIIFNDAAGNVKRFDFVTKKEEILLSAKSEPEVTDASDYFSFGHPVISPDGKKINLLWYGYEWGGIGSVDVDGKNFERIDSECGMYDFAWAPDGKRYATGGAACLYVGNIYTHSRKEILNNGNFKEVSTPVWSPDGTKIAFSYLHKATQQSVSGDTENVLKPYMFDREIYVVNADGSGLQQITFNGGVSINPLWKDNHTIVYDLSWEHSGIFELDINTKKETLLTNRGVSGTTDYRIVSISPDGMYMAFLSGTSDHEGYFSEDNSELNIYRFQDNNATPLMIHTSFVGWLE